MDIENFFEFYMNERYWKIYEKSQQEMKDYYNEDGVGYYYGQTHFATQEIWLSEDIPPTQLDKTLFHELMHCYIRMYITTQELELTEEYLPISKARIEYVCNQIDNQTTIYDFIGGDKYER